MTSAATRTPTKTGAKSGAKPAAKSGTKPAAKSGTKPAAKKGAPPTKQDTQTPRAKPEEIVADKIIELLDRGELPPWVRPWNRSHLGSNHNAVSRRPYRGINIWLLAASSFLNGYTDPRWLTYRQAQQLGGNVRKGEASTLIIFWKIIRKRTQESEQDGIQVIEQDQAAERPASFPMARFYNVFNAQQTHDCEFPDINQTLADHDPMEEAESIIAGMPYPPDFETYLYENQDPHYIPAQDKVRVPDINRYTNRDLYYNSVFHELVHSTGHEKRLSRFNSQEYSGKNLHDYATEELVAGMGSAMLTAKAGIETAIQVDASYIKYWAGKIRADKSIIMTAAQRAQRAVDYICPPTAGEEQEYPSPQPEAEAGAEAENVLAG